MEANGRRRNLSYAGGRRYLIPRDVDDQHPRSTAIQSDDVAKPKQWLAIVLERFTAGDVNELARLEVARPDALHAATPASAVIVKSSRFCSMSATEWSA